MKINIEDLKCCGNCRYFSFLQAKNSLLGMNFCELIEEYIDVEYCDYWEFDGWRSEDRA